jgi:hypothetical protein
MIGALGAAVTAVASFYAGNLAFLKWRAWQ